MYKISERHDVVCYYKVGSVLSLFIIGCLFVGHSLFTCVQLQSVKLATEALVLSIIIIVISSYI